MATRIPHITCLSTIYNNKFLLFANNMSMKTTSCTILLSSKNSIIWTTQERLKDATSRFCIEVRYLQPFIVKVELNCYSNMTNTY